MTETDPKLPIDGWQCLRCGEKFECVRGKKPLACDNPNCKNRRSFTALTGPFRFFYGEKFVPKLLADDLMKEHHFATHRESWVIYHYQDGYYRSDGEAAIRELCREKLMNLAKEQHINEVIKQIRDTTFRIPQDFNPPPHLICVENGILDTGTRKRAPHTPDLIFLQKLPAGFKPAARCPTVIRRLLEWTNKEGLVRIAQYVGFCLYRNYFIRKAIVIHGEGENGKTTLVLFLTGWLGEDNVAAIKVQNLEKRFAAARLIGKLANICDDLPGDAWFNTGAFKQLTGGSPIEAEQKFKEGFLMINYAKALFTANRLPIVSDASKAFWDRMAIIPFEAKFTDTVPREKIVDEMLTEEERSGFLNLALDGLEMLRTHNRFFGKDDNEATKKKYIKLSDPIMAFAHERMIESPLNRIPKADVYGAYVDYCTANGFPVKEDNAFSRSFKRVYPRLDKSHITTEDGRRVWAWIGVDLTTDPGEEAGDDDSVQDVRDGQDVQVFSFPSNSYLESMFFKKDIDEKHVQPVQPVQNVSDSIEKQPSGRGSG